VLGNAFNMQTKSETSVTRPVWIRLPKPGERCAYTGLSRSALNELILPSRDVQNPRVASISLRKPHEVRGIRLIKLESLLAVLDDMLESSTAAMTQTK
jgi:hypothetical protein